MPLREKSRGQHSRVLKGCIYLLSYLPVWLANNSVHPVLNLHSLLMVASVQWAVQTEDNSSVLPLNWIHHLVLICRDLVYTDTKCHPKSINASLQFFNYLFFLCVAKEEILTNNFFPRCAKITKAWWVLTNTLCKRISTCWCRTSSNLACSCKHNVS